MPISDPDKTLVRLFMTACFHTWEELPGQCDLRIASGNFSPDTSTLTTWLQSVPKLASRLAAPLRRSAAAYDTL